MVIVTSDKIVGPTKLPFSYPGTYKSKIWGQLPYQLRNQELQIAKCSSTSHFKKDNNMKILPSERQHQDMIQKWKREKHSKYNRE